MSPQKDKPPISAEFSAYLDILRLGAAAFVLLFHTMKGEIGPSQIRRFIPDHGHDGVILFFVLSGYVIAATVDRKRSKGLREYALDRMARVYSVAIPTLIFCTLLEVYFQTSFDVQRDWGGAIQQSLMQFFANAFFIAESWFLEMRLPLNNPYWSLCYEVMYYVGFGVFTFMSGRARWLGIVLVTLIAGPKVILLLPCWILGVLAYELRDKWILKTPFAFAVAFILPPVILVILHYIGFGPTVRAFSLNLLGNNMLDKLDVSRDFLVDYMTALIAALNLYAVRYLPLRWPTSIKNFASAGASMSFTLYLVHMPLLLSLMAVAGASRHEIFYFLVAVLGVPLLCHVVSLFTELRRPTLRVWLDRLVPDFSSTERASLRTEEPR